MNLINTKDKTAEILLIEDNAGDVLGGRVHCHLRPHY